MHLKETRTIVRGIEIPGAHRITIPLNSQKNKQKTMRVDQDQSS